MNELSQIDIVHLVIILIISLVVLLIIRSLVWWYFGIYEILDRMDKNNNLLTDIREILKKSTNIKIEESKEEKKY